MCIEVFEISGFYWCVLSKNKDIYVYDSNMIVRVCIYLGY